MNQQRFEKFIKYMKETSEGRRWFGMMTGVVKMNLNVLSKALRGIFLVFFLTFAEALAVAEEVAVIANPSAPSLSKEDIKALYLGFTSTLPDGTPAEVLVLKGNGAREKFLREVLGVSWHEFKSHWLSKALAGEGVPPKELSPDEIIKIVRERKGAIGVVPADKVTPDVKVVLEIR